MALGAHNGATRARRSVLGEIVQDLVQQWARASQAQALANARRAATAASAGAVERAEIDAWLDAQPATDEHAETARVPDDDSDEVGAGV